jgi:hypothetical protein
MSALAAFCTIVVEFFEDISEQYPEEKDIATATNALKLLKKSNPRLLYKGFMKAFTDDIRKHVMAEDEEALLESAKEMMTTKYSSIGYAFWIFDKHWSTMSETNKQHVWKYIKAMIVLAGRVPPASQISQTAPL